MEDYTRVELNRDLLKRLHAERNLDRLAQQANQTDTTLVIPMHIALRLCHEIRQKRLRWWITPSAVRCRRCLLAGHDGIPARLAQRADCTGCPAVTARYRLWLAGEPS